MKRGKLFNSIHTSDAHSTVSIHQNIGNKTTKMTNRNIICITNKYTFQQPKLIVDFSAAEDAMYSQIHRKATRNGLTVQQQSKTIHWHQQEGQSQPLLSTNTSYRA